MIYCIKTFEDNYSYIIKADDSTALIVDPGEATKIIEIANKENLKPLKILLTHSHSDHTGGVKELQSFYSNLSIIDSRSENFIFNNETIKILKTPGHTFDSCCFYLQKQNAIFTGDTLFIGLCGRVMEGTLDNMFTSLQLLSELPAETKIYPGHEYLKNALSFLGSLDIKSDFYNNLSINNNPSLCSTIGDENNNNPFLTRDKKRFKELRTLKG